MPRFIVPWLAVILLSPCVPAAEPPLTPTQISRLESLCRVWGVVKFFHPWIVAPPDGKPIDWDAALIESIPLVANAQTADDFHDALNHLLRALKDPATRAWGPRDEPASKNLPPAEPTLPDCRLVEIDGHKIFVISASDWRRLAAYQRKSTGTLFTKAFADAADTEAIVLDIRNKSQGTDVALRVELAPLLTANLPLPGARFRFHRGYDSGNNPYQQQVKPQYYSGRVTREDSYIKAKPGPSAGKRLIVLTSSATNLEETGVLAALQTSGQAVVIHNSSNFSNLGGSEGDYGIEVGEAISTWIRTADYLNADGSFGLVPAVIAPELRDRDDSHVLSAALTYTRGAIQPPTAPRASGRPWRLLPLADNSYPEMIFPSKEYRLLGLFQVWNVIHYFFPYQELMDRSWDAVLTEFLPRFYSAENSDDYGLLAHELMAQLRDSHCAALNGLAASARQHVGYPVSSILLRTLHGEMGVVSVDAPAAERVRVGDVVLAVDGEPIAERREKLKRFISASTPQVVDRSLSFAVLLGPVDSPARLTLRAPDGTVREESLPRTRDDVGVWPWRGPPPPERKTPVYSVLPSGYGYIDVVRLTSQQLNPALEAVKNTPALVLDIRGRPQDDAAILIGDRFAEKPIIFAKTSVPIWESPHRKEIGSEQHGCSPSQLWRYTGPIVVLTNEMTQSAAEHCCLCYEQAAKGKVTFMGTPTSGANGGVAFTSMPGGITIRFTGTDVRHADGRQLQRIGIQPDIRVEPTIAGIAAGKDEVLDAAIKFLNESK
jgi:C-terminal processing protease CtpA/Prc